LGIKGVPLRLVVDQF